MKIQILLILLSLVLTSCMERKVVGPSTTSEESNTQTGTGETGTGDTGTGDSGNVFVEKQYDHIVISRGRSDAGVAWSTDVLPQGMDADKFKADTQLSLRITVMDSPGNGELRDYQGRICDKYIDFGSRTEDALKVSVGIRPKGASSYTRSGNFETVYLSQTPSTSQIITLPIPASTGFVLSNNDLPFTVELFDVKTNYWHNRSNYWNEWVYWGYASPVGSSIGTYCFRLKLEIAPDSNNPFSN